MSSPDWRSGTGYDEAVGGGRRGLAWEFLRRNPDYHPDDIADGGDGAGCGSSDDDPGALWGLRFRR